MSLSKAGVCRLSLSKAGVCRMSLSTVTCREFCLSNSHTIQTDGGNLTSKIPYSGCMPLSGCMPFVFVKSGCMPDVFIKRGVCRMSLSKGVYAGCLCQKGYMPDVSVKRGVCRMSSGKSDRANDNCTFVIIFAVITARCKSTKKHRNGQRKTAHKFHTLQKRRYHRAYLISTTA